MRNFHPFTVYITVSLSLVVMRPYHDPKNREVFTTLRIFTFFSFSRPRINLMRFDISVL